MDIQILEIKEPRKSYGRDHCYHIVTIVNGFVANHTYHEEDSCYCSSVVCQDSIGKPYIRENFPDGDTFVYYNAVIG